MNVNRENEKFNENVYKILQIKKYIYAHQFVHHTRNITGV